MRSTDWHGAASALLLLLRRRRRRLRTRRLASRKSLVDHFPAFAHEILVKGGDVEAGGDVRHHLRHDGKQLRKKKWGRAEKRGWQCADDKSTQTKEWVCGPRWRVAHPIEARALAPIAQDARIAIENGPLLRLSRGRHATRDTRGQTELTDTSATKLRNRRYRRWRSSEHGATTVCHSADGTT